MKRVNDIRLDDGGDLLIRSGDFDTEPSDNAHIAAILAGRKGHYRFYPLCGAEIEGDSAMPLSSIQVQSVTRRVELQLRLDGYAVAKAVPGRLRGADGREQLVFEIEAKRL